MRVLVTGGAGFIGSVVTAELVAAGHDVTVVDDFRKGHRKALPSGVRLVEGDFGSRALLDEVLPGLEGVLHFAAYIEAGESMQLPEKYFRNNSANALTLLEAMLAHRVNRLVFSSTAALYGNPARVPIEEDDPLAPTNAYGESKLLVEQMLGWMNRAHGLRYASLRYFNAAGGAEDHRPETHLIPILFEVAQGRRSEAAIYGTDYPTPDGTCVRDYVHVRDLASAHLLALGALGERDRLIYNLGNGQGYSVREVVETVRRVTGHPLPVREAPRRPGDPAVLVASSARIRRELGWEPRVPGLEEIVRSAWEWRSAHPEGYGE